MSNSILGSAWITNFTGLPEGFYQNGIDIGSSSYIKPITVPPIYTTGLLTTIPAGYVGLYACKWVNNNYTGPILKLRNATTTQDFYMDSSGNNISTEANGRGISLTTWLNGATAYVNTWYDQSTQAKHAIQTNTIQQPTYSQTNKNIYFGNNARLVINSNGITLFATGNIPYTVTYKTGLGSELFNAVANCCIFSAFSNGTSTDREILITTGKNYIKTSFNEFNSDPLIYNRTSTNNEVVTHLYNSVTNKIYLNANLVASKNPSIPLNLFVGTNSSCSIGYGGDEKFTGSIEYLCVNNTALSDENRLLMERVGNNSLVVTPLNIPITNFNFAYPVVATNSISHPTPIPFDATFGWSSSDTSAVSSIVANGTAWSVSPTVTGSNQYFVAHILSISNRTWTLPLTLASGNYRLEFWHAGRNTQDNNINLTVTFNTTTTIVNALTTSQTAWAKSSNIFNVPNAVTANLRFNFNCSTNSDNAFSVTSVVLTKIG